MEFSIKIVKLCDGIKGKSAIVNQLLRSGTSIGANIHEANYASSRADFIAKMQIALKECYETEYWLSLFAKTDIITQEQYKILKTDCGKIRKLLISSINTAKKMRKNWTHHFGEILCDVSNVFILNLYIAVFFIYGYVTSASCAFMNSYYACPFQNA